MSFLFLHARPQNDATFDAKSARCDRRFAKIEMPGAVWTQAGTNARFGFDTVCEPLL